jgi:hypothetical protein
LEKFQIHPLKTKQMLNFILDASEKKGIQISDKIVERIHEIANGCPREALLLLEKVCNATNEEEANKSLDTESDAEWIREICGHLLNRMKNWSHIAEILKKHDEEDIDNARRGVLGYMQAVVLDIKTTSISEMHRMQASEVIEIFGHTFWEGGRPKLVQSFYKAFLKMQIMN